MRFTRCIYCDIPNKGNTKSQARSTKWFGQLTILNQVEGQIQMTKTQNSKQDCLKFTFGTLVVLILDLFGISIFGFRIYKVV